MGFAVAVWAKGYACPWSVTCFGTEDVVNIEKSAVVAMRSATGTLAGAVAAFDYRPSDGGVAFYSRYGFKNPLGFVATEQIQIEANEVVEGIIVTGCRGSISPAAPLQAAQAGIIVVTGNVPWFVVEGAAFDGTVTLIVHRAVHDDHA